MREIRVETEIQAPADAVRRLLLDFPSYPRWNPFIRRMEGRPAVGERLRVRLEPPGGPGMTFRPTVLEADEHGLRWIGRLIIPGLFDGEHQLCVPAIDSPRSRFVQSEAFSGLLVPLLGGILVRARLGFEAMNRALKEQAEAEARSKRPDRLGAQHA